MAAGSKMYGVVGYKIKLYPNLVKSDMLSMLCALFAREHAKALDFCAEIVAQERALVLKGKSQTGQGEFKQRVRRRAAIDYQRAKKAARALKRSHVLPYLTAELCDSCEVQEPRKAKSFDLWIHVEGLSRDCQLYIPARKHTALTRTLALPGAQLSKAAEVFRKNGKWYARVAVKYPIPEVQKTTDWLGGDVGLRSCITRSDRYQGRDLRPILQRQKERQAERQRQGHPHDFGCQTPQRQVLAYESRRMVTLAKKTGRGIALEDPKRLPRYKQWAGRYLANRVQLLAAQVGVPVALIAPPYTSITCPECGSVEKQQRHRELFRCWRCGYTANADFVGSRNIARRASLLRSGING